ERLKQLDLRRGEGAHLDATCGQIPNEFPLLTKGNEELGARACEGTLRKEIVLRADVGNVEGAMPPNPANLWFIRTDLDAANRYGTKMSSQNRSGPLVESQHDVVNPTNSCRALDDGVEDRLHVGR